MLDPLTPEQRQKAMRGNRGKNTRLELAVRRGLHARGFRFRLHGPQIIGSPDIILKRFEAAIFVHGCFWHRHPGCKLSASVKQDTASKWAGKFQANIERDQRNIERAFEAGYRVAVVWECAIEHKKPVSSKREKSLEQLAAWLRNETDVRFLEVE